jgi:hypothetical protein
MKRLPKTQKETIVTTIKMDVDIYDQFRSDNIKNRFTLQDLVNKALYLYVKDTEFKNKILNFIVPKLSINPEKTITLNCTSSVHSIPVSDKVTLTNIDVVTPPDQLSSDVDISNLSDEDLIELGLKEKPPTTI